MAMRYRYSMWDGTQEVPALDPDQILDNITDDLMNFGDLQHALRNLMQRGMRNPMGQRMQGLRDLLQQLRQQRRQQLDRFDLSSIFDDLKRKLDEILELERNTLERRLEEADRAGGEQPDGGAQQGQQRSQAGQQPAGQQGAQANQQQGQRGEQGEPGEGASRGSRAGSRRRRASSRRCCGTSPTGRRSSWRTCRRTWRGRSGSCRTTSSWTRRRRRSSTSCWSP